jgi:uncharacterized membrane-anchored protein
MSASPADARAYSPPADPAADALSKVPRVTLAFWAVKVLATTLGETGGDALSMSLELGYAVSTLIFLAFFVVTLIAQLRSSRYHPLYYWAVVVATTTVGTTASDYFDRSLGLGYVRSSAVLFVLVLVVLGAWRLTTGHIAVDRVVSRRDETYYWLTILVSNTLGTALGDYTADDLGLGFEKGALLFAGLIVLVAVLRYATSISTAVLFWAAYVLTRPLGATLGDTLTKPTVQGGLDLSRIASSLVIALLMIVLIAVTPLRKREARTQPASP